MLQLSLAFPAWAQEPIWLFEDPTGQRTLDEIKENPQWFELTEKTSRGYTKSTFWIRIDLVNSSNQSVEQNVSFKSTQLPRVQEYSYRDDQWVVRNSGYQVPLEQRPSPNISITFPHFLAGSSRAQLYYRIQSPLQIHLDYEVLDRTQAAHQTKLIEFTHMAPFVALAVMWIFNFLVFFLTRERIYGYYTLLVLGHLVFVAGQGRVWEWLGWTFNSPIIITYAATYTYIILFWFWYNLFTDGKTALSRRVTYGIILYLAAHLLVPPFTQIFLFSKVTGFVVFFTASFLLAYAWRRNDKLAKLLALGWLSYISLGTLFLLSTQGQLGVEFEQFAAYGVVLETLFFALVLSYRLRLLDKTEAMLKNEHRLRLELEQAREELYLATSSGRVGLYTLDLDSQTVTANEVYRELYEISASEYPDEIPNEILHRMVLDEDRDVLDRVLRDRDNEDSKVHNFELGVGLPSGDIRHLFITNKNDTDQRGHKVIRGSVIDITRRKIAEDRLRAEVAKQEQLFAIIGHELRTPASALKMLIEDQRISELEPHGGVIAETAEHLLRVLDDMRIVTQPERVLESPEVKGSVPAMIQRSLPLLGRLLVEQGLSVYIEASEQSHSHCVVREQLLRQIALNIVKNAALHAHATAMRIGIEAEDLGESIRFTLEFADNGRGIPAEQQEQIFEAFERGDTEAEGTGLGLHISRTYAQNILNGDLNYRDNDPQGAIFTLTAVFNKTSLELEKAEQEAQQIAQMNLLDGLTVLYAEDSPVLRMTTVKQLQKKGATVLVATDGREALEIADNQPFDLVITDIFMPNLDGYGVTSRIRKRGFDCLIIGVTAAVVGDETDRLIACGANAALAKPLDIAALQKVIAGHSHLIHALNKSEDETARRRRVLVIDDDPITLARFEVLLEDGFDVRTQGSALKAIEDFRAFNPDVILCDVNMPDMNGFEVFKEIHSLDPSVPIIQMSSTRASEHYLSIAKTMGAAEIMDKRSDGDEVLRLIHQVLKTNTEVQK